MNYRRTKLLCAAVSLLLCLTLLLPAAAVGAESADEELYSVRGDVNGDGSINNIDASVVLQYDAGLISDFPASLEQPTLSPEAEKELSDDYSAFLAKENGTEAGSGVPIHRYLGNYSGLDVAMFVGFYDYMLRFPEVAGYILYFSSTQEAYVRKDGSFYTIAEAYGNGFITKEDVRAIGEKLGICDPPVGDALPVIHYENIGDYNDDLSVNNVDAAQILRFDANVTDTGDGDTDVTAYRDMLPEPVNMGGREFKIMERWFGYGSPAIDFRGEVIWQDSEDGTMSNINLAKKQVLEEVQEKYNCKITGEMSTETAGEIRENIIRPDIMSTHEIDFCFETYYYYYSFVTDGLLTDLNTLGIDFTKPWWDQDGVEDLSVANKLYYALGDINTYDNDGTTVMLVNKNLYDEKYGDGAYKELYKLAADGKWTFKELEKRVTGFGTDNGDGVRNEFDTYGLLTETANLYMHVAASGEKVIDKDTDDLPLFALDNERVYNAMNDAVDLYLNSNDVLVGNLEQYYIKYEGQGVYENTVIKAFKEGRGLFYMCSLIQLPYFRDMDDDFGILPIPKYDESQDRYYHTMSPHTSSVLFVPVGPQSTGIRGQQLGVLLDALGAYSKDYLTPEYYDKLLRRGDVTDPDSAPMLDLIFDSRTFDLGAVFGAALSDPIEMCNRLDRDLRLRILSNKDILEMSLEDMVTKLEG